MSSNHIQNDNDLEQGDPDASGSTIEMLQTRFWNCKCFRVIGIGLLVFPFVLIFPILFTPLLILSLLVARLLQFICYGDGFIRAARWKYYIHTFMLLSVEVFLFDMAFYYPMVKFTPGLRHVMILGLPFSNWLVIACEMCGLYVLGLLSSLVVHALMFSWIRSEHSNEYKVRVAESVSDIIKCLIFWWGESEVMKHVPVLKQYKILGIYTSKWINVTIFSLIGYNCIVVSTNVLVRLIHTLHQCVDVLKHVKYYASGLGRSITFVLTSVMLLLIWVLYLGQHLNQKPGRISYVGTGTFVSLVICSLLWLLKTCIVIAWEAQVLYGNSTFDSVTLTKVLGLLGLFDESKPYRGLLDNLSERLNFFFHVWNSTSLMNKAALLVFVVPGEIASQFADVAFVPSRYYYFKVDVDDTTTYAKQLRVLSLLQAKYRLEEYTPARGSLFDSYFFHLNTPSTERVTIKDLELLVNQRYKNVEIWVWEALISLLRCYGSFRDGLPEEIPVAVLTKCLDQAIANLLTLANIVGSYREMVDCLDKIMSWAIIGATFIIWLLLTRLASTRILVIIATPLVAASFIFGDTCKNLFQGIVFVYAIRPFGVGDECNIGEDSPLRVTSIGVWKTVFSKTIKGTQVTVIYPNSELANKRVLISRKFHFEQLSEQETAGNDESTSDKTAPEESNKPTVPEAPTSNKPAALDVKDQTIWLLVDHEGSSKPVALDHEGSSKPAVPDVELPN